jgi:predicted ester cyclase
LFANLLRERSTKEISTRQGSSSGKTSSSKFRFPGQGPGLAGLKDILRAMRAAFADLHWSVEEQIVEGDKVVTRFEWTGRHCAEFLGIPATGREVRVWGWLLTVS